MLGGKPGDAYAALDDAEEDDEDYAAEDQPTAEDEECEGDSCEDSVAPAEKQRVNRGRRVLRKAGQRAVRQARRKLGHRMYLGDDEMKLKDAPGSWHWYLMWGSLLLGTLAVTGGGANYAYVLLKSQLIDKMKPVLNAEKEDRNAAYTASTDTETDDDDEEHVNPPAEPPNDNFVEEMKSRSEYLALEDDFKTEPRATFAWCQSRGLLRSRCPYCDARLDHDSVSGGQFRCAACSGRVHVLDGTWFDVGPPAEIWRSLAVPFHWTLPRNHVDAALVVEAPEAAAAVWYKKCRDVTDFCLGTCDPGRTGTGTGAGEGGAGAGGGSSVTRDHYVDHDHALCPLYRLGGPGRVVEVDVVDKGRVLADKFVLLCADRDSGLALACPMARVGTPAAVRQVLRKKLREGTNVLLPVDERTGGRNGHYVLPDLLERLLRLVPAGGRLTEDMLSVYVSQVMWKRRHEDCTYDHFRIMINHISKYFRLN